MSSSPQVILISSDEIKFPVDQQIAEKSILIKNMINDLNPDGLQEDFEVPISNVKSTVLSKVLEWCEHYRDTNFQDDDDEDDDIKKAIPVEEWDKKFLTFDNDDELLFDIITAANFLNIKPLLETGCKMVADLIMKKSPEELRRTFRDVEFPSPENETRRENEWAEDR
ncbi:uncharacterized protein J8A68_004099 [[Candida] subhashii]|uniref:E3 ubiquitin ligase complex SCF subunit n=1 Tax=[Candida] subhashii TaxID=561895 RepID=A0A8J5UG72_9ASCO|nr:uncharacterized protein J8A68_004099 [[Candida] subhashii]KAG7662328.1 hypothetical protein J8A68_004099 [[Candida] subhashii]